MKSNKKTLHVPLFKCYRPDKEDPLHSVRKAAWDLFVLEGVNLLSSRLQEELVFLAKRETTEESMLTALSRGLPRECTVCTLSQAQRAHGPFFQSKWSKVFQEKDPLSLFNLAVHEEGAWAYLPAGVVIQEPLRLEPSRCSRFHLYLGTGVELSLHIGGTPCQFYLDISLERGAKLHLHSVKGGCDTYRCALKKGAQLSVVSRTEVGSYQAQESIFSLLEEGAKATFSALSKLEKGARSDVRVKMHHLSPSTFSTQNYRTVLNEASHSQFNGEIVIEKGAQLSEAFQQSRALILDKGAVAKSSPTLRIFADDVKANHGATVSQLDEGELFYLTSRGVMRSLAKELLIEAFCKETLDG